MLFIALVAVAPVATAQKGVAKATLLPWTRVPLCLDGTVGPGAIKWTSPPRDVKTARATIRLAVNKDLVAVTMNDTPVALGSDVEGKPLVLSDTSMRVWALPDCATATHVFVEQTSDGAPVRRRYWFYDGADAAAGAQPMVRFPDSFEPDTVVAIRDGALTMTNGSSEGNERAFRYHPAPVRAFVVAAAQPKYVAVIGKPNSAVFESAAVTAKLRAAAGDESFGTLRLRTGEGRTDLFLGRYLIVAGSTAGDYIRHAAVVIDIVSDASYFVVCTDEHEYTGVLTESSSAAANLAARDADDVLAAFRYVGFTLLWSEQSRLACDGECHDER